MEVSYKRDLSSNYLIIRGDEKKAWDYEIHMITENRMPGFLSCICQEKNREPEYYYEITGKQSLSLLFERQKMGYEQLRLILRELAEALEASQEFLLNTDHILLCPEYMYLSSDLKKLYLCYYPGYEKDIREAFLEWTEYLLGKLEKNDTLGIELGYDLYQAALEPQFTILDILREHIKPKEKPVLEKQQEVKAPEMYLEVKEEPIEKSGVWKSLFRKKGKNFKSEDYVAEEELPESGERLFLKEESPDRATEFLAEQRSEGLLLKSRDASYPDIHVTTDNFLIGKRSKDVDGCIASAAVSRLHARIVREEGKYTVEDLNSTNGSWIDGHQLNPYDPVMLVHGMRLAFANIEFEVHL